MSGSPINDAMIDNNDGTYEYTFTISKFGNATVSILLSTVEGVRAEFYYSGTISGSYDTVVTAK